MTEFALVDAFATRPFEGNQAAVVVLDEPADPVWMQSLASELGFGATCFVHGRDLRWFAPAVELTFCGHGTLATAHLLWERGATEDELRFSTAAGQLTAQRHGSQIEIDLPVQHTEPAVVPGLAEALGAEPVAVGRAPLDLVAELASADTVRHLAPDLAAIARIDARGVIVTAAGDDGEHAIVSRFFGPAMGIPEDSATGSAHCALASVVGAAPRRHVPRPPGLGPRRDHRRAAGGRPRAPAGGAVTVLQGAAVTAAFPKIELHVHIEGTVRPSGCWRSRGATTTRCRATRRGAGRPVPVPRLRAFHPDVDPGHERAAAARRLPRDPRRLRGRGGRLRRRVPGGDLLAGRAGAPRRQLGRGVHAASATASSRRASGTASRSG